jgi:hypothetical protein
MQWLKKILKKLLPKQIIQWLNAGRENVRYRSWRILWVIREKAIPQNFFHDPYKTNDVYWVNPKRIRYHTLKEFNYFRDKNRVVGGNWDISLSFFEENDFFQAFSQRIKETRQWSDTKYYKRNLAEISAGKMKWGCKNKEEWDQRCAILDSIYQHIKNNGYYPQRIEDYISVNIGRNGQLLFNNGRHRLTFCKLLEVPKIPIRITVRHAKWVMFKNQIFEYAKNRNGKVYAPLTHIDLQSVPSYYGHKRFELIQKNITAFHKGTVLDIGSNWGYFCHRFEELGFDCLAVESDPEHLYFLEKLKKAEERNFSVFNKSVFSLDLNKKKYDIVLALAVFHHFTKWEETYNQLIHFLKNLHVEEMYFEPQKPDEPQMQNAFRNFTGNEFVEFIINNSCLTYYKGIGFAEDGRKLYKIW